MRIFIIDDSAAMRSLLSTMMKELRHETAECCDGETAVSRYAEFHPDLVLVDIRMPGMDGIETARQIRLIDPQARIVMVTEVDEALYRDLASEAGAMKYFLKDDLSPLVSFVRELPC